MTEKLHLKHPAAKAKIEKKLSLHKRSGITEKKYQHQALSNSITAGAPSRAAAAMCISAKAVL